MTRTQETAGSVSRRLGLPVVVDPAFAEADFGRWEGRTVEDVEVETPGAVQEWYRSGDLACPGGESLADVGHRVGAGLEQLVGGGVGRTVVVVSHAMAVRAALGATLGMPVPAWTSLRVVAGSVSIVRWWADGGREAVVVGMPPGV